MGEIIIRKIKRADVSNIEKLGSTDTYWAKQIAAIAPSFLSAIHREHSFVALLEDNVVGFIYAGTYLETTFIPHFMYVLPDLRKQGIGQKLLETAEKESKCASSLVYYHKSLHDYYEQMDYKQGNELEIAIKPLRGADE